ncbi:hypothetical protein R3I94_020257 [Phoxinus phoxinus]
MESREERSRRFRPQLHWANILGKRESIDKRPNFSHDSGGPERCQTDKSEEIHDKKTTTQ